MYNLTRNFLLKNSRRLFLLMLSVFIPAGLLASGGKTYSLGPVGVEFIIFALILLCVAFFHKHTFRVAVTGLAVLLAYKFIFDPGFHLGEHLFGTMPFGEQLINKELREGEWGILLNLLGLLRLERSFYFACICLHFFILPR
jgi:hypothetical protein